MSVFLGYLYHGSDSQIDDPVITSQLTITRASTYSLHSRRYGVNITARVIGEALFDNARFKVHVRVTDDLGFFMSYSLVGLSYF